MTNVDITFRNVEEEPLRNFKAEAVRENKTFGEALAEALKLWLEHRWQMRKKMAKLTDIKPADFGIGTENLSKRIDEVLYYK